MKQTHPQTPINCQFANLRQSVGIFGHNDGNKDNKTDCRLRRCIATINRWTDYCNNREIIIVIILDVSKTSQNNRSRWFKKIITPMVMLTP